MTLNQFLKNIILIIVCSVTLFLFIHFIQEKTALYTEIHSAIAIVSLHKKITNSTAYQKQLSSYFSNPYIKAIILKIDSHALSAATSYALFYEIQALKKEYPKPLIALIENECLGYAYLVACATDYIVATEGSLIGNIGTTSDKTSLEQNTNAQQDLYEQLIKHIAITRKLSLTTAPNWAQEKIFTGHQAVQLGLINTLGSLNKVIQLLKEKGFIDSEIVWIQKSHKKNATLSFKISF